MPRLLPLLALLAVLPACRPAEPPVDAVPAPVVLDAPAGPGSRTPDLLAAGDRVYLTWQEAVDPTTTALRLAVFEGDGWSEPRTIADGADWFVNWADFPTLAAGPDGRLAAHYLARSGEGTYAYGVRVVQSADDGATWSPAVTPHTDGTPTEHGFVSMLPADDGFVVAWLDGRNFADGEGHGGGHGGSSEMTLRTARLDAGGGLHDEALLDARTCDCCQTTAVPTPDGVAVFYRDRSDGEMRDLAVVRRTADGWTEPAIVHADGWRIEGCPVNGPAADARGSRVAVAWFTAAQDTPRVLVAFSDDGARTFGAPVRVDDGAPAGRVDLILLEDGSAAVSWVEQASDAAEVRLRRVRPGGTRGEATSIAAISGRRSSGFPRLAPYADGLLAAWTDDAEPSRVRTARLALPD